MQPLYSTSLKFIRSSSMPSIKASKLCRQILLTVFSCTVPGWFRTDDYPFDLIIAVFTIYIIPFSSLYANRSKLISRMFSSPSSGRMWNIIRKHPVWWKYQYIEDFQIFSVMIEKICNSVKCYGSLTTSAAPGSPWSGPWYYGWSHSAPSESCVQYFSAGLLLTFCSAPIHHRSLHHSRTRRSSYRVGSYCQLETTSRKRFRKVPISRRSFIIIIKQTTDRELSSHIPTDDVRLSRTGFQFLYKRFPAHHLHHTQNLPRLKNGESNIFLKRFLRRNLAFHSHASGETVPVGYHSSHNHTRPSLCVFQ